MTRNELRATLQLLLVLAFFKTLGIIAIGMVLFFRGQWMTQTDACIRELAESTKTVAEIAVENRKTIAKLKNEFAQ